VSLRADGVLAVARKLVLDRKRTVLGQQAILGVAVGPGLALQLDPLVAANRRRGLALDDGELDDALRSGEVLLQQERRHAEDIADVVEAVADVIAGEVGGGAEVDAEEIADGVVVLSTVEPADRDAARVAALAAINDRELLIEERQDRVTFRGAGLRLLGRRHL